MRRYRGRSGGQHHRISFRSMPVLFPDSIRTTHKMTLTLTFQLGDIAGQEYYYSLNNLQDPDPLNPNGIQPLGYDQWRNFYDKYIVFGNDISIQAYNNSSNKFRLWVRPSAVNTAYDNPDYVKALRYTRHKLVSGRGGDVTGVSNSIACKVLAGRRLNMDPQYIGNTAGGSGGSSQPEVQFYWHVGVQTEFPTESVVCIVTMYFKTMWFERITLPAST